MHRRQLDAEAAPLHHRSTPLPCLQYGYPICFERESGVYDVSYAELWECDTTIWQPMVAGKDTGLTCSKACHSALSKVRVCRLGAGHASAVGYSSVCCGSQLA